MQVFGIVDWMQVPGLLSEMGLISITYTSIHLFGFDVKL